MHDSLITGKEYVSEGWTCGMSMFLTSFDDCCVCGCECFMCILRAVSVALHTPQMRGPTLSQGAQISDPSPLCPLEKASIL